MEYWSWVLTPFNFRAKNEHLWILWLQDRHLNVISSSDVETGYKGLEGKSGGRENKLGSEYGFFLIW
jgi:hypothetical protein